MNRLAQERSPYLLQHAGNPVEWFPWGEEAFAKARAEDKPIFLSIGYSTCHWCHVMEHESFENVAVADVLNDHFVAIKVDREERPDVDRVYMTFVQATTGSGGWPMSVWLTPDLKPFYGGTYFPPTSRWGRPGFVDILQEIARVWRAERENVRQSADALTAQLRGAERATPGGGVVPGAEALERTVTQFRQSFDARHGGFGDAPKFPRPSELLFLLREYSRTGNTGARDIVLATLRAMALGGMRDHIGGGFHRYSVDAAWRVPHFEKMLYDQAQLSLAYLEAAQASGDPFYIEVAEDTLRYVMRQMTDEAGGFYSAEDADSVPPEHAEQPTPHKMEGAFYLWRADEIDRLFGRDAETIKRRFGIEAEGNAPTDPQQEFTGKNLLYVARGVDELATDAGKSESAVVDVLNQARLNMFRTRVERPHPHLDDKVLTAWNGLMIAAFARVARVVRALGPEGKSAGQPYLEAAQRAATFIQQRMWNADTAILLRRYRAGHAEIAGYAEDYAFLIFGLLELFQADPDPKWLSWAVTLQRRQDEQFWDEAEGGWFSTTGTDPSVLLRMKEDYDGAEPTPSSVSVLNLLALSHLVNDHRTTQWTDQIDRTLRLFGPRLDEIGRAVPMMAAALSAYTAGLQQIVIVGSDDMTSAASGDAASGMTRAASGNVASDISSAARYMTSEASVNIAGVNIASGKAATGKAALERAVALRYLPFTVTLSLTPAEQAALAPVLPFIGAMQPVDGEAAAYVCRDFACREPATSVGALEMHLK